jgi:hypothetical protein
MGFYQDRPPRHGHRTPSELAEDEFLSAAYGDFCGMPEAPEKSPIGVAACMSTPHFALLPWADAHPFAEISGNSLRGDEHTSAYADTRASAPRPGSNLSHDNGNN